MQDNIYEIYKRRSDLTWYVTHLTKRAEGRAAFEVLKEIIKWGCLFFNKPKRGEIVGVEPDGTPYFMDGYVKVTTTRPTVCFTDQTLVALKESFDNDDSKYRELEPYGIALHKAPLFACGGRPVIYVDNKSALLLGDLRLRHTLLNNIEAKIKNLRMELPRETISELYKQYHHLWDSLENEDSQDIESKFLLQIFDPQITEEELSELISLANPVILKEIADKLIEHQKCREIITRLERAYYSKGRNFHKYMEKERDDLPNGNLVRKLFYIYIDFLSLECLHKLASLHSRYDINRIVKNGQSFRETPLDWTHEREWRCNEVISPKGYPNGGVPILLPRWDEYPNAKEKLSRYSEACRKFKILVKHKHEVSELRDYVSEIGTKFSQINDYYSEYYRELRHAPIVSIEEVKAALDDKTSNWKRYTKFDYI